MVCESWHGMAAQVAAGAETFMAADVFSAPVFMWHVIKKKVIG